MRNRLPILIALTSLSLTLFAQKPDLFVLSVGVAQYSDIRQNLNYCAADARDLADAFSAQTQLYNVVAVKVFTDAQATRAAIRQALDGFEKLVTSDDLFVFIFSGHGIEDRLLPFDFDVNDQEASTLSKSDLLSKINRLGCGYLLFIDACHSGSFAKSGVSKAISAMDVDNSNRALVDALASTDKPYLIFGSSGSDQISWECAPCKHGYFAQTLLDAIQNKTVTEGNRRFTPDANNDGYLSPYELDNYIKEAVRVNTAHQNTPQKVYSRLTLGQNFPLLRISKYTAPSSQNNGGNIVIATDQDHDGITDNVDDCPSIYGTLKGCPDSDDDGIPDYLDDCPEQKGNVFNKGCPDRADSLESYTSYLFGTMVLVKGGTFNMGCDSEQKDCDNYNTLVERITLDDYYIGQTEVTQSQWRAVMGNDPPDLRFPGCDNCPVERVTDNDIHAFLKMLNNKSQGSEYRLPTEAEWEFAARGGRKSKGYLYAGSNNLDKVAWHNRNAGQTTHPVKGKMPNELGLYDMSGNVWEWCSGLQGSYSSSNRINTNSNTKWILRGGSWDDEGQGSKAYQVTFRIVYYPLVGSGNHGFRLARSVNF